MPDERIEERIRTLVAEAPPFTPEQRDHLAAILRAPTYTPRSDS